MDFFDDSGLGDDGQYLDIPQPTLTRQPSIVDDALNENKNEAKVHISHLMQIDDEDTIRGLTDLPDLKGAVFVGHTSTDMDSIASAIGAAELFEGVAARASEVNPETEWVLQYWDVEKPPPFLEVKGYNGVCLVDHNQISQMTEGIEMDKIVGCIDHHALQSGTIVTEVPIYVNIQPWGSACSILASMFVRNRRPIQRKTAGMLLCGILSDTLNLHSPTTTKHDKLMLAILADLAAVDDVNKLAQRMFKEKSKSLMLLSSHGLLRGDLKFFTMLTFSIAFGVCETVLPDDVLAKKEELLMEMRALKKEKKLSAVFFAVVNILDQTSTLLVCGQVEQHIAELAFSGTTANGILDLGNRCSRKKQFIPPLSSVLGADFTLPEDKVAADQKALEEEVFGEVVMDCTDHGCIVKRRPRGFGCMGHVARAHHIFKRALHRHRDPVLAHAHAHEVQHHVVKAFKSIQPGSDAPLLELARALSDAHEEIERSASKEGEVVLPADE